MNDVLSKYMHITSPGTDALDNSYKILNMNLITAEIYITNTHVLKAKAQ